MIRRTASSPTLYLRLLIAWLLALQPMIGAYANAAIATQPLTVHLCSGAVLADEDAPVAPVDHASCCLAACAPALALPPGIPETAMPRLDGRGADLRPSIAIASPPAGIGPQAARAPPL